MRGFPHSYKTVGPNLYHLSLLPPTVLLDCERFELKASSVSGGSVIGTITHSGFQITEADEMYHTAWKNVDDLKEEVRLSPLFEIAEVKKVLVENFATFEIGDALVEVEGRLLKPLPGGRNQNVEVR